MQTKIQPIPNWQDFSTSLSIDYSFNGVEYIAILTFGDGYVTTLKSKWYDTLLSYVNTALLKHTRRIANGIDPAS